MIKFIEVVKRPSTGVPHSVAYTLSDVWINKNYVVSVREAPAYKSMLAEGLLPTDLNENHSFTTVTTNNGYLTESHVVVGSAASIANRLAHSKKSLLKG